MKVILISRNQAKSFKVFKRLTKNEGKNKPSHKSNSKGHNQKAPLFLQKIKNVKQNLKKIKFPIRHSQPISYTSALCHMAILRLISPLTHYC